MRILAPVRYAGLVILLLALIGLFTSTTVDISAQEPPSAFSTPINNLIPLPGAAEPTLELIISDNFDSGDLSNWLLGAGWSLITSEGGQALTVSAAGEVITLKHDTLYNVAVQARFSNTTGEAHLSVRQSVAGNYTAALNAAGQINLYRAGSLIHTALTPISLSNQWHTLRLSVIADMVRVSVDGQEIISFSDNNPLPAGAITMAGVFTNKIQNSDTLLIDDFFLWTPLFTGRATDTSRLAPRATEVPGLRPIATPSELDPEPDLVLLMKDKFDTDLSAWTITEGWSLVSHKQDQALKLVKGGQSVLLNQDALLNVVVQAKFQLKAGSAWLNVRQTPSEFTGNSLQNRAKSGYTAYLYADGQVELHKNGVLIAVAEVQLPSDKKWHKLRLSVIKDVLRVAVNDSEVVALRDSDPLPAGTISLGSGEGAEKALKVDDFKLWVPVGERESNAKPEFETLVKDNFDSIGFREWMRGTRWEEGYSPTGLAVETRADGAVLPIIQHDIEDLTVKYTVQIIDGAVQLRVRESQNGSYIVSFDHTGLVTLYRGEQLLHTSNVVPDTSAGWHTLIFAAVDGDLSLEVDGIRVFSINDPDPLPAGAISLVSDLLPDKVERILRIDKVKLSASSTRRNTLENSARSTQPSSTITLFDAYQASKLPVENLQIRNCEFTLYPEDWAGQGIGVPVQDLIVYDDWEGGVHREEIRIKHADSDDDGDSGNANPGGITDGVGFKLVERIGSVETDPALSPDGTRLAFVSDLTGTAHIYVLDLRTFACPIQITQQGAFNQHPAWSPDGTRIAFQSLRDEVGWKIYITDAFGPETAERLTQNSSGIDEFHLSWSPDGRYIAYSAPVNIPSYRIYEANVYGSKSKAADIAPLVEREGGVFEPVYSPDGSMILFKSYSLFLGEPYSDIYLQRRDRRLINLQDQSPPGTTPLESGTQVKLTIDERPMSSHDSATWSPDQTHIAFRSNLDEGGLVTKIHILDVTIRQIIQEAELVTEVRIENFGFWPQDPFTAHGFWVFGGGPNWSQYVSCPNYEDPNSILEGMPQAERFACLKKYGGMIFTAIYHEGSDGRGLNLDEIPEFADVNNFAHPYVDEFSDFQPEYDYRYLYARASLNGMIKVAQAGNLPRLHFQNYSCTFYFRECENNNSDDRDNNGNYLDTGEVNDQGVPFPSGTVITVTPNNIFDVFGGNPAWMGAFDYECEPDETKYSVINAFCLNVEWYNQVMVTRGSSSEPAYDFWRRGYRTIYPQVIMVMHDEVYDTREDILLRGSFARNANNQSGTINTLIYGGGVNEGIAHGYMIHLDRIYVVNPECVEPVGNPPRVGTDRWQPYLPSEANVRFGSSGTDGIYIHILIPDYSALNSNNQRVVTGMKWTTAVFDFGPLYMDSDNIYDSYRPANLASEDFDFLISESRPTPVTCN